MSFTKHQSEIEMLIIKEDPISFPEIPCFILEF
jgi:hypothetical protein